MITTELDDYLAIIENEPTFAGILYEYYDEIFHRCKDGTKSEYNGKYNLHILPEIGEKKINELTLEDCERLIGKLKEGGQYKPSTIQQYRYLVRAPIKHAVELGLCENILFGTIFAILPKKDEGEEKKKELVVLKKSFNLIEEYRLYECIMCDYKQTGEKMGVACMYAVGVRNAEACGANYGAIKEMEHYPGHYCLWIYETTDGETRNLKAGGKTPNAPRILPIHPAFAEFLLRRKAYLEEEIAKGTIELCPEKGFSSVNDLPIACKGNDFTKRCSSRDLTDMGREILREIKINEEVIAYIASALEDEENQMEMGVYEKNPTVYLMRRHLGTTLYLLGFTEAEIQYYMGHNLVETDAIRNEFTNEERLYKMALKLDNHPLFSGGYSQGGDLQLTDGEPFKETNNVHQATVYTGGTLCKDEKILLYVTAEEPNDPIEVSATDLENVRLIPFRPQKKDVPKVANIIEEYQNAYRKICKKKEEIVIPQEADKSGEKKN